MKTMPGSFTLRRLACFALPIVLFNGCLREFRGRVVDAKTGEPKAGVRIEVYESGLYYFFQERLLENDFDASNLSPRPPMYATSVTRADGSFSAHPKHRPSGVVLIVTDKSGNGKSEPIEAGPDEPVALRYEAERYDSTLNQRLSSRQKRKWRLH